MSNTKSAPCMVGPKITSFFGLSRFEVFWKITFPLSLPGVIGAILIIFIPTVGDYVTPALLGGTDGRMLSNMIQAYFGKINNIPPNICNEG